MLLALICKFQSKQEIPGVLELMLQEDLKLRRLSTSFCYREGGQFRKEMVGMPLNQKHILAAGSSQRLLLRVKKVQLDKYVTKRALRQAAN